MGGSLGLCSVSVECGQRGREHAVGMSCAEPVKRPEWEGDPSRRGGCVGGCLTNRVACKQSQGRGEGVWGRTFHAEGAVEARALRQDWAGEPGGKLGGQGRARGALEQGR